MQRLGVRVARSTHSARVARQNKRFVDSRRLHFADVPPYKRGVAPHPKQRCPSNVAPPIKRLIA